MVRVYLVPALALALALGLFPYSFAQNPLPPEPPELADIARELDQLRARLDRLAAATPGLPELRADLEKLAARVAELESAAVPAPTPSLPPASSTRPIEPTGLRPFNILEGNPAAGSGTSFNPALSVIPDFVYSHANRVGDQADQGFDLRETEIAFSGAVDPYFHVYALFAATEENIETEEAYFETRRLPAGWQIKAGKFFSGFGYANRQHPHQWDFTDGALPYQMVAGGGLNEKGLQVTWTPRWPIFVQFGGEVLQGRNEAFANDLGSAGGAPLTRKSGPRLFTTFAKLSPDLGDNEALELGLSLAHATHHQEAVTNDGATHHLQGTASLFGIEAVFKHDAPGAYGVGDLVVSGEFLRRTKDLNRLPQEPGPALGKIRETLDGFYVQGTFGWAPRWTISGRWDGAGTATPLEEPAWTSTFGKTRRISLALAFSPTEFSRLRLQFNRTRTEIGGLLESFQQITLQFQLSLGAHGAHKF